jgi:hypothetical protein
VDLVPATEQESVSRCVIVVLPLKDRPRSNSMPDVWTIGPTAAARALRACGFSPRQAERLVALKLRYDRGAFKETSALYQRLLFARWLVDHGYLDEGQSSSAMGRRLDR